MPNRLPPRLGRVPCLDGPLQSIHIERAASPAAALGTASCCFAEESPPENTAHVKRRRDKQRGNQEVLNFDGSESEEHAE